MLKELLIPFNSLPFGFILPSLCISFCKPCSRKIVQRSTHGVSLWSENNPFPGPATHSQALDTSQPLSSIIILALLISEFIVQKHGNKFKNICKPFVNVPHRHFLNLPSICIDSMIMLRSGKWSLIQWYTTKYNYRYNGLNQYFLVIESLAICRNYILIIEWLYEYQSIHPICFVASIYFPPSALVACNKDLKWQTTTQGGRIELLSHWSRDSKQQTGYSSSRQIFY